jgi:hypothetical protein
VPVVGAGWRGERCQKKKYCLLCGSVSLLNVAVDEGGDGTGSRVDLILLLGDGQLAQKLLEGLEGLGVLGLDGRSVVESSGSHVVCEVGESGGRWRRGGCVRGGGLYIRERRGLKLLLVRSEGTLVVLGVSSVHSNEEQTRNACDFSVNTQQRKAVGKSPEISEEGNGCWPSQRFFMWHFGGRDFLQPALR